MKKIFIILILLTSLLSFSQKDSIKMRQIDLVAFKIDSLNLKATKKYNLKIDSVKINVSKYPNKIETKNLFINSNSKLSINYYFKEGNLILVRVKEQSPTMDDLFNYTVYYYENGKVFTKDFYHSVRICLPISLDENIYELYGYNKELNADFLSKYIEKLYSKIKNHR